MTTTPPARTTEAAEKSRFLSGTRPRAPLGHRLRLYVRNPVVAIGVVALALFAYLIAAPIVSLLVDAFVVHRQDTAITQQGEGAPTSYYLWRVLVSPQATSIFWEPLANTLIIAVSAIVLALVIGGSAAWLLVRTNMWGRKWFSTALIVPYMLPAWTFALAWVTLFKNRTTGGQAGWMENLGFTIPNWLSYGRLPIILIFAVHFSPFVIMLIGNALKSFDTTLEESSRLLGASRLATTFRIVIPILRPALISAVTLMLAKILGEFGVAYILGLPVNMNVLATSLYRNVYSDQKGSAAVMVAAIVLIGALSLWVDTHFLRESKRFVTISGKSGSSGAVARLGRSRWVATLACTLLFTASVAIPIVVLALSTVMRNPGVFTASNFTLDFWVGKDLSTVGFSEGILRNSEVWQSAWNSVWIVGLAALLSGVSGLFVGYVVVRSPSPLLSAALRQLVFFPYLVPGIAFAVAYLSLFSVQRGPIPALYGTAAILVLIYFTEQMPFTSRSGISAMMQLGADPEESAQMAGAGWWRRFVTIVLPIQKGALASGAIMAFISGIKSLSLVVILAVPGMDVLTTLSIRLLDVGYSQAGNAVVLLIALISFTGTYTVQKVMKTDLAHGIGG
ncbi:ABC transporter permease [Brachybacterium alimentarium]|uniref:ABC transporter permease n=1 Tax=Brachybacterium alimentarium TaxID=47845 RepID=UPI0015CBC8A8|nr:iron ABC transporter permease [Brachybacterium alimentarium]